MSRLLPLDQMRSFSGFGAATRADGYRFSASSTDQIGDAFDAARCSHRQVVVRAGGRSYGDANYSAENIVLDLSPLNRINHWDPITGLIEAEPGVTLADVWKTVLPDGYWPPVVSGTMWTTLGGALAMNIHGKNHFKVGSFGEHVESFDLKLVDGTTTIVKPSDPLFNAVVGSAGLLGVVSRVVLRLAKVPSGIVRVVPIPCSGWDAQFRAFEDNLSASDYLVGWIDCFKTRKGAGRGIVHAANYAGCVPDSFRLSLQELPDKLLGVIPKSGAWRLLRPLSNRSGMRLLNALKHFTGSFHPLPYVQSLAAYSFLLDAAPGWQRAYEPDGFIQFQAFVPANKAPDVFPRLIEMQARTGMESFLGVLKRHRPDPFLISYALDGHSLALDLKVHPGRWDELNTLCQSMADAVLDAGGRFYWAKDSTLRPQDVRRYLGSAIERFQEHKKALDPEALLTSALAHRLELFPGA